MKRSIAQIEKDLREVEAKEIKLLDELEEAKSRRFLTCRGNHLLPSKQGCRKKTSVKNITYIEVWVWDNCEDYKPGEDGFECPQCGAFNRSSGRSEIKELKRHFGSIEKHTERWR